MNPKELVLGTSFLLLSFILDFYLGAVDSQGFGSAVIWVRHGSYSDQEDQV